MVFPVRLRKNYPFKIWDDGIYTLYFFRAIYQKVLAASIDRRYLRREVLPLEMWRQKEATSKCRSLGNFLPKRLAQQLDLKLLYSLYF